MSERLRAACVQLRSSDDPAENLATASAFISEAAAKGAQFVATPENTCLMAPDGGAKLEKTYPAESDPAIPALAALAEELSIHLLIGSLAIRVSADKTANRSYLFDPKGRIAALYDKVHLFDVDLPSGETYRESRTVAPGSQLQLADVPPFKVGLTVCYDVRFPQLYRALAQRGATLLTVPAAFTQTTGQAHWHVLLRARAIENGAYVLAPAQGGMHANGRATYGHSLIIGPWGEILAEGGTEPGVILADLDLAAVTAARARVPSLRHDRPFEG
ncbi:MAG: carbon-nitrogen hydrolase family protein [Alphaproteobacteria bacterium]|nr:carbon-nitrogen hydrolase family protein [Alphaproteobacteria bacterium]